VARDERSLRGPAVMGLQAAFAARGRSARGS
jgi:hypothetical protein